MHDTQHTLTVPAQPRPPKPDYTAVFLEPAYDETAPLDDTDTDDETDRRF